MIRPIYLTIGEQRLLIIPDTQAHLDGHIILTHTYQIYKQSGILINNEFFAREEKLAVPDKNNPDYMGYLVFDIPGKLFSYYPEGPIELRNEDLKELISNLSEYRDNPGLWPTV